MKFRIGERQFKLWDRFTITNRQTGDESPYLTRLSIVDTPWFGLFHHTLHRPDAQDLLHDHPWSFLSFVLTGGYVEITRNPQKLMVTGRYVGTRYKGLRNLPRRFNRKRIEDAHFITRLDPDVSTTTLVIVGPDRREWGYWEPLKVATGFDASVIVVAEKIRPLVIGEHYPAWRWTRWDKHPVSGTQAQHYNAVH